jgi:hypothetical protein
LKIEMDVLAEAGRLANAARIPLDTYLTHALRHYNRFHAVTKNHLVRWSNDRRVVAISAFDPARTAPPLPPVTRTRRRERS